MECVSCDSNNARVFLIEKIPCDHCDNDTELIYVACPDCSVVWKMVGDVIIDTSLDNINFDDVFEIPPEVEDIMNEAFKELMDEGHEPVMTSMADMVHRCLRCESISYEVKPRFYHCPDCGFEWEVL